LKREVSITNDGSKTLYVPELDEHYHSVHGAYNEAMHVFIDAGLNSLNLDETNILEIGFGTGLNALLTLRESLQFDQKINYTGVEAYPVLLEEIELVDYKSLIKEDKELQELYLELHSSVWETQVDITPNFTLTKQQKKFADINDLNSFDLIYFDAFAPNVQPDLWSIEVFEQMLNSLKPEGMLVTYCAQGQVKRNMKAAGFYVERLPGPPGKREMTKALKPH